MNRQKLKTSILQLIDRPVYTNIEIISKGNVLHILKDKNYKFYLLTIPNKPLNDYSFNLITNIGYKEKFAKTNYSKFIDYSDSDSLEKLFDEIIYLFNSIYQIPSEREWRFEFQSGMGLLKELSPISTFSERRTRNRNNKFKLRNLFKYDILLSLILGLSIGIYFILKGFFPLLKSPILIILIIFLSFIFIKLIRLINFVSDKLKRRKLFTKSKMIFFKNHNFKIIGDCYRGIINEYQVDIHYESIENIDIVVYHKEIPWERVIELSENSRSIWSKNETIFWNTLKTIKRISYRLFIPSAETIIKEAERLVEKLIENKIEPRN